jgi:antitoxin Phd
MNTWPVQDAKARFSELLDETIAHGPQVVTRRGQAAAVVVPIKQWQALMARAKPDLKDVLLDPAGLRFDLPVPPRGGLKMRKA